MYFFALCNQITYIRYLVGKSTPFSISQNLLVHQMLPIFRGCDFFLAVITHSIFIIRTYRKIHSYPNSNELISFKMSSFVCVFICSISSCSPSPFLVIVDPSSIPTISPTSPWLNHVYTEEKQNLKWILWLFLMKEVDSTNFCNENMQTQPGSTHDVDVE